MNILAVDDHEENLYFLESLLKPGGNRVLGAANGAEALEILKSEKIGLVISDILMPVMDGFQLCLEMKKDDTLRAIPFIFYTATYTGPQDEAFARKIGADLFLVKPCEPDTFLDAVEEVMAGASSPSQPSAPGEQDEVEVFKLYNERLIRKLEQKMIEVERELEARKAAEEELKRSEERYRTLVENAGEVIVVAQEGKIRFANRRVFDLLGVQPEELKDRPFTQYIHPEDRQILFERRADMLQGKFLPSDYCFRVLDRAGRPRWVEINAVVIDWEGRPATLNFLEDITERKQAQDEQDALREQLAQSQKVEAIGRLAGGVAHDFNNMLSIILGYGDMLLGKIGADDPLRDFVLQIVEAAKRSAALTRQLLAFSRKQTLKPEALDLNDTLSNLEKMLRRLIGEDIELKVVPGEPLAPVMADPGQIEQVILNLAINARDAMPGGGKLIMETSNVDADEDCVKLHEDLTPGSYVLLSVSDTGCGMDDDVKNKIFEPFFTTKDKGKGTGLGLATVYGIVKQSGGNISVVSAPGKGASFKIYLPRTETAPAEAKAVPAAGEKWVGENSGGNILIVEDEEALRNLMRNILSRQGFTVTLAADGIDALRFIEEKSLAPDLLITDVVMPGISGFALVEKFRTAFPDIRVLYMSGYTDQEVYKMSEQDRGAPFMHKPFSIVELTAKVKEAMRGGIAGNI